MEKFPKQPKPPNKDHDIARKIEQGAELPKPKTNGSATQGASSTQPNTTSEDLKARLAALKAHKPLPTSSQPNEAQAKLDALKQQAAQTQTNLPKPQPNSPSPSTHPSPS